MKKLLNVFKLLLSCCCVIIIGGSTYICLYEIYNSFFSSQPKNIVTYHSATQGNATATSQSIDKEQPEDIFDNSLFSEGNKIGYTEITDAELISNGRLTDLYKYSQMYTVLVKDSSYNEANGVLLTMDEEYLYIAACYSSIYNNGEFEISFSDGTTYSAVKHRHDSVRNYTILKLPVESMKESTLRSIAFITDGNILDNTPDIATLSDAQKVNEVAPEATEVTAGEAVIALGAVNNKEINISCGYISSELKTIQYGDTKIAYYHTSFNDDTSIFGSLVIDFDGNIIGVYTATEFVVPAGDLFNLI